MHRCDRLWAHWAPRRDDSRLAGVTCWSFAHTTQHTQSMVWCDKLAYTVTAQLSYHRTCSTSEGSHATLQVNVQLDIESIPMMDGALECADSGVASSLLPSNLKAAALVGNAQEAAKLRPWPLLFDPQTSGGLLAG